jgi:cytochrome c-type biogenesis protein CcmH/NrfF
MNPLWLAPLAVGVVGAAALAVAARRVSRDAAELQRSLRPLRVRPTGREEDRSGR